MLQSLSIKNYALIQELEMHPAPGLSMITGETGAGKSIMLGAIGLLMGNRADTKVLYNEEEKCIIEGVFDVSSYQLQALFEEEEIDYDNTCIIRREVSPAGKSRAFINDTPATLDTVKRIGLRLMDVHSQHETLLLGDSQFQLDMVDAFAGNHSLLTSYRQSYQVFKKLQKDYQQKKAEGEALQKEADLNQFLFNELEAANLQAHEQEELEELLQKLENAEEIKIKIAEALAVLSEGEFAAESALRAGNSLLQQLGKFGETFAQLKSRLESVLIETTDVVQELAKEGELIEYDPERIALTKERLTLIYQLQQKHRVQGIQELLQIQEELGKKVEAFQSMDETLQKLQKAVQEQEKQVISLAKQLSDTRKKEFAGIEKAIKTLLQDLGMPDAQLSFQHEMLPPQVHGSDDIRLLFSANKGMKPQELKSVASGGEFSRLMFSIKYLLADKTALPTIIFDEIDTGISGEIALKMVKMMRTMASRHQVITISHLPQMAAKGEFHYFVFKDNSAAKTVSRIKLLEPSERVEEIAKMIGGASPSENAYQTARELLEMA
ncbi:DNA repair protein RecN [Cytophagales bacterium LB-30]|uniref:DNA repair protein RecN n=1 Tax=Shiella aurantiaca TaxID=3058365 RepID=A0ABT8F7Y2_9BACT|nr:DNA repair protein RecN [Shiella aurantiaca]MDN4166560.1 DNA repair protein RecN [Shiella aurantiaca]